MSSPCISLVINEYVKLLLLRIICVAALPEGVFVIANRCSPDVGSSPLGKSECVSDSKKQSERI